MCSRERSSDGVDPAAIEDNAPVIGQHGPVTWLALHGIRFYRRFFSPVLPPSCRFVPSCSEFGYEAIAKYGIIKGGRLAVWRILRCNPISQGGYDPVP